MWVKHIEGAWSYILRDNWFVVIVQELILGRCPNGLKLCIQGID